MDVLGSRPLRFLWTLSNTSTINLFDSSNAELSPERYWYGPRSLEVWEGMEGGGDREREKWELLVFS